MALVLYHSEPVAASAKVLIALHEKGLAFEPCYVDLRKFEQHEPAYLAINPDGQTPTLKHDGVTVTHSSVMCEYLEDAFPDAPPLRPEDPAGRARMRVWTAFVDEQVTRAVTLHRWRRRVSAVARAVRQDEFDDLIARMPLAEQKDLWRQGREGFDEARMDAAEQAVRDAVRRAETQLATGPWLAGDMFTLADISLFASCTMMLDRLFGGVDLAADAPRLAAWDARVRGRPAVGAMLGG